MAGTRNLLRGSARDALGERLQWESIFGSQVRKDYSAINMNDLVRENLVKIPKVNFDTSKNNMVDTPSAASLPNGKPMEVNENKFDDENVKSKRVSQISYPTIENDMEENLKPSNSLQYNSAENGKFGKFQMEYGNKLKTKPLKEELGSIKLPDVNISPFKPLTSQSIDSENVINKAGAPIYDKERRLFEGDFEPRRAKRDLSLELENTDTVQNKDLATKRNVNEQSKLKNCVKNERNNKDSFAELNSLSNIDSGAQIDNEKVITDYSSNTVTTKNTVVHNKLSHDNDMIKKVINGAIDTNSKKTNKANSKPDEMVNNQDNLANEQMLNPQLINDVDKEYSFSNNENNVKRDIHLDTSEKSWQPGEGSEKYDSGGKSGNNNHKNINNANQEKKFLDTSSSSEKKLEKGIESNIIKESKSTKFSKARKSKTQNDDDIMVSALESVVKDMEKTKVKKDVLGGFTHLPLDDVYSLNQPFQPKTSAKYNDVKYVKLDDENPVQNFGNTWSNDENVNKPDDSFKSGVGLIKDSRNPFEGNIEPDDAVETPNHNNVDEIIIKIKTPEGTVSEVKQNLKTDNENLRKSNIDLAINSDNNVAKDSLLGNERNQFIVKNNFKTSDAEKSKRGVDSKTLSEVIRNIKNQGNPKNTKDNSAQELNIVVEAPQQSSKESGSDIGNSPKVKRDDNTIHLVIETEPEVKSPEGRSSESAGSNIFCQGKNCLEIKPIYLNDTIKVALSNGSNNNVEGSKDKVVEKRDTDQDDEFCGATTTESPMRCHDFYHRVFNLELMITVDFKVVQMHEDDDIENFILTIINMVSSNFDDKSIGLNLNVVLVRLILLTTCIKELDSDRFNPQELLENFCTWQVLINPGRDDHPHHHDLAIFISKMDKCEGQVMGVSYMTSVCRPDKACIVCIDEGLLLANTITHQIGHSLGADHDDGQNSGCPADSPDGTTFHMAPKISETSNAWSVCSRDSIIQFVQTQGSWCLNDFPVVRSYNFPLMLPGQIYSAAQQCKLNFHMTAIPCSVGAFCDKLYCQITDKLCATKGDPPADGTFCASNMWCFHKQCVHVGRRPGAINGEWGPWTEWSLCTRSCGGGVSSSYRICNNPKPENGGRFCIGERIRHRICQAKPCQGFTESFRDLQCKRTEDRPFRGKIHNWIQYQSLFINIECSLVCQNRKGDVVMRSPVVADGTPCKAGTRNVCIQGSCRNVGCDYVIDSNAKEDACGICHGNGTECRIIQGIFDEAVAKKGLIEFLRIPKDSGMIFVREVSPSTNTLVVSGSINRVFYLNGLGSEDSMAGDVAFGLTHGVYEKRGGMERVFIRGPTKEDLIFYVLFRDINKGIHYQYATLEVDPTYIPRYQWQFLDWDACSDPCSGGSQRARAKCVEDRGGVVDDKYCTESTRPLDIIRPCNDFPCQAKWWVSVWSDCICTGTTSVLFRSVLCMRATDESGTRAEVVRESECAMTKKPPTQKPCNYSEEDTDCAKRSISDDSFFHVNRDLRRAVNPRLAFSAFSPSESEGSTDQDAQISTDHILGSDENKKQGYFHGSKIFKKSRGQTNKNINSKGSSNKAGKPKLEDNDQTNRNKISSEREKGTESVKPIDLSSNEGSGEPKPELKSEESPLMESKGRQIAKLNQKNGPALADELKSATVKQAGDDSDVGAGDVGDGKGASENCETSQATSMCPTEENTSETPTTCKETCAPQGHKKTTCCKTTPHRQYVVKTTMETTTIRPVAVKLDELNVNNFAITVVPLDFVGKKRILPQSDPEFINLGAVGQFGVADELNATVVSGQEALDLLEFARSNASEEPDILHDDMHN